MSGNGIYPKFKEKLIQVEKDIITANLPLQIFCDYRSYDEQNGLFLKGRDEKGNIYDKRLIVTNSRGGYSYHNFGLAADFVGRLLGRWTWALTAELWKRFGDIAKSNGLRWGGDFKFPKDNPHCEYVTNVPLTDMRALYDQGGLERVWKELDKC